MFVTLFYALLNPATGEFTYVNAGHNPPLLCKQSDRADPDPLTQLTRTGMVLGILGDTPFEQRALRLNPGDLVVLYTDGVTDAVDVHKRDFGMGRLQRLLLEHRQASATDVVAMLEGAIGDFAGSAAPFDDIAIVVTKRLE